MSPSPSRPISPPSPSSSRNFRNILIFLIFLIPAMSLGLLASMTPVVNETVEGYNRSGIHNALQQEHQPFTLLPLKNRSSDQQSVQLEIPQPTGLSHTAFLIFSVSWSDLDGTDRSIEIAPVAYPALVTVEHLVPGAVYTFHYSATLRGQLVKCPQPLRVFLPGVTKGSPPSLFHRLFDTQAFLCWSYHPENIQDTVSTLSYGATGPTITRENGLYNINVSTLNGSIPVNQILKSSDGPIPTEIAVNLSVRTKLETSKIASISINIGRPQLVLQTVSESAASFKILPEGLSIECGSFLISDQSGRVVLKRDKIKGTSFSTDDFYLSPASQYTAIVKSCPVRETTGLSVAFTTGARTMTVTVLNIWSDGALISYAGNGSVGEKDFSVIQAGKGVPTAQFQCGTHQCVISGLPSGAVLSISVSGIVRTSFKTLNQDLGKCSRVSDGIWLTDSHVFNAYKAQDLSNWLTHFAKTKFWAYFDFSGYQQSHRASIPLSLSAGVSEPCVSCFEDSRSCGKSNCMSKCAFNPYSDSCNDCITSNCRAAFKTCTGLSDDTLPPRPKSR